MRARLILPLLLAFCGAAVLAGCFPIPVYRPVGGGPRPEERIGGLGSKKQIQLGSATRQHVRSILGVPKFEHDSQTDIYVYELNTNDITMCFGTFAQVDDRFLRLDYDSAGVLRGYKVFKSLEEARKFNWQGA